MLFIVTTVFIVAFVVAVFLLPPAVARVGSVPPVGLARPQTRERPFRQEVVGASAGIR